jgi:competence protein ComEC
LEIVNIQGHGIIDLMPSSDSSSTPIENFYFRPIIPLVLAFISGIVYAVNFPCQSFLVVSLSILSSGIMIHRLIGRKKVMISPLVLFACLGHISFASVDAASSQPDHVSHFRGDRTWNITGTVASEPVAQARRQKCILKNIELSPASGASPPFEARGNIQVNIYGRGKELAPGQRIMVTGKIKPVRSFQNPGGFDYTRHMMRQNIWGTVSISDKKINILRSIDTDLLTNGLNAFRRNISGLISQASAEANGDARAVLSALIIGDRRELSTGLQEAFNRVGVSHVLSISGLHVGIVATAAFIFFKWLLSFSKPLLLRAWTKKGAAACAVFPVLFYGLIAGMEPATQRSVIMVSVFLMTFLIEREHDLFNTIATAALVILIIDPPALFSISFQLSFAAVLSISWGMTLFQPWISQSVVGRYQAARSYVLTLFCVSLCAMLGVAPLVMHYFNTFPISGLAANLIVVPLMGTIVVVIGLFSVLVVYPVSALAALWGLKICNRVLEPVIDFIYFLSDTPFAAIKTITPSILETICCYLLAWGCIELIRNKWGFKKALHADHQNQAPVEPKLSPRLWVGGMVAIVLIILFMDIIYWIDRRLWNDDLKITLMDVGQGNAAVLEMPGGYCMVIDGGGFGDNSSFDTGERVLAPFLWRQKIRTVDTVVLTHPDADHLNGLIYILKHFHVKQVISTHQASDTAVYKDFINIIQKSAIDHPEFSNRTLAVNGAKLEILHPYLDFMERHASLSAKDINNKSIVLKACFNGFSILLPGDIMEAAEKNMVLKRPESLAADVLVAPHHGSKTSSSVAFLDAVDPKAIIISCGKGAHFPSEPVLERYQKRGVPVYRTDHNGAARVVIDNETMTVEPMQGEKMIIRK